MRMSRTDLAGVLAAAVGALALLALVSAAQAQVKPGSAEITRVTGRVEVRRQGQAQWAPAVVGARLGERDEIRSFQGGSAELKLPDASTLLLSENSRLVVNKLEFDSQGQGRTALFHLAVGKVRAVITRAAITLVRARQSNFAISTPTAVAAARGTDMAVAHNPVGSATLVASLPEPPKGNPPEVGLVLCTILKTKGKTTFMTAGHMVLQVELGDCSLAVPIPETLELQLRSLDNPATLGSFLLTVVSVGVPPATVILALITGDGPALVLPIVDEPETSGVGSLGRDLGVSTGPAP